MKSFSLILLLSLASVWVCSNSQQLPSLYEYFTEGGITSGLVPGNKEFRLNGKYIKFLSGGMHYFRVHPDYWQDRLRKLRAMGANAVETYVSWNLHEPMRDQFDFGEGNNDFSAFMNIRKFIQLAQEEDLLVILRPGPFICAEWDWGGLPSWLAQDPTMKIRENHPYWIERMNIFFQNFLGQLVDLQFTRGGPIVAIQIENEYANFNPKSLDYLKAIQQSFIDNEFDESLFFTADNSGHSEIAGGIPGVMQTANTDNPDNPFTALQEVQPDMPLMAMEFYTGWFTHWFDSKKGQRDPQDYIENLDKVLGKFNGSVNLYMFHGGTNWAFMSGANGDGNAPFLKFDVTSYEYNAPLSEAGDYTPSYTMTQSIFEEYENPKLRKALPPSEGRKALYPDAQIQEYLSYQDIIDQVPASKKVVLDKTVGMDKLPINDNNGQSYGYIIYRTTREFAASDTYKISWPRDLAQLLVDGQQFDTGYTNQEPHYLINNVEEFQPNLSPGMDHTVDVLVESLGRVNYGTAGELIQDKGIDAVHQSKLEINDVELENVEHIALELSNSWTKSLSDWRPYEDGSMVSAPCMLKLTFTVDEVADTFLDMRGWHHGAVFVNGFNIGRYWKVGPQQSLYVPGPLLKVGENELIVFEQFEHGRDITFRTGHLWDGD